MQWCFRFTQSNTTLHPQHKCTSASGSHRILQGVNGGLFDSDICNSGDLIEDSDIWHIIRVWLFFLVYVEELLGLYVVYFVLVENSYSIWILEKPKKYYLILKLLQNRVQLTSSQKISLLVCQRLSSFSFSAVHMTQSRALLLSCILS